VIAKRHVVELYDLTRRERAAFVEDLASVGRAVAQAFGPVKLDTLMMGHLCPHLHCHIYPQYDHDDPHKLINVQEGDQILSEDEHRRRIELLQRLLSAGS
jgi:diadenosine tetraphosphate (Ap4A) HIT family hydrolase